MRATQQAIPEWVTAYLDQVAAALEGLSSTRSIAAALELHDPKGGDGLLPILADQQLEGDEKLIWEFQICRADLARAKARRERWAAAAHLGDEFWEELVRESSEFEPFEEDDPLFSVREAEELTIVREENGGLQTRREIKAKWEEEEAQRPQSMADIYRYLGKQFGKTPGAIKQKLRKLNLVGSAPRGGYRTTVGAM